MRNLSSIMNRVILITCSAMLLLFVLPPQSAVLPITILIAICGFLEYFGNQELNLVTFSIYCVVCILNPYFIFGLPAVFYDLLFTKRMPFIGLSFLIYIYYYGTFSSAIIAAMVGVTVITLFLKYQANSFSNISQRYIQQRDDLTEQSLNYKHKINDLTFKQDVQIKLATLDERNRIARDIHDNVGHLLTRSIISLGAVMAINKDAYACENLSVIKDTLDEAMNTIRSSVHNLYEDSIDLYEQVQGIVKEFEFCEVKFVYEVSSNLKIEIKYSMISIIKEALVNVMKHSQATQVTISMFEHPRIIQLIIQDNGIATAERSSVRSRGLGLESIRQRVEQLGGHVNFDSKQGFKIFISFPHNENQAELLNLV